MMKDLLTDLTDFMYFICVVPNISGELKFWGPNIFWRPNIFGGPNIFGNLIFFGDLILLGTKYFLET